MSFNTLQITTKSNSQWKILLERKDRTQPSVDESDIAYMGFENINININILHHPGKCFPLFYVPLYKVILLTVTRSDIKEN